MSPDINTISAVRQELCERIIGMRIDKVQQPQRDVIILTLRGKATRSLRLLISLSVSDMRVHLTQHVFENPASPPMFCMLLRKHLTGARIENIEQPPSERVLEFTLKTSTAMGDAKTVRLVLELFGRLPNLILIDSDGIIIDCLRRIGGDMSGDKRMLLPGLRYRAPELPQQNMLEQTQGLGDKQDCAGGSISEVLDGTYTRRLKSGGMHQRSTALRKTVKNAQKRITRRLAAQRAELEASAGREFLRQNADIIMANMHRIKKGDAALVADDFFAEGDSKREIGLDPLLSPQRNAEKYYKAYTKARNAERHLTEQIRRGEAELTYIESVIEQLVRVEGEQELEEIREELAETGYVKRGALKTKNMKPAKAMKKAHSKPLQFFSSSGIAMLAGKNNTQNEKLTLRTAHKSDIWLHAQKIHGSHVIIKTDRAAVDDTTLQEAAAIAAYYSAARDAGKVPVDYTLVKNVKKQPGAHPGMVIYTEYKTIAAKPDEALVLRLKA